MALKHISLPYTEQGAKLALTAEQEETCKVLYRNTEGDLYEFAGLYDPDIPDEDYPDGLIALSLKSALKEITLVKKGTKVWNVEGSTKDPWHGNPYANWIQIWEDELVREGCQHNRKCYVNGSAGINCNTPFCGGHMVMTNNTKPDYGTDGAVHIIPICNAHNNYHNKAEMVISEDVYALVLDNYHQ